MPKKLPPEHSRFKPGQSGNPSGKKPMAPDVKRALNLTREEYGRIVCRFFAMREDEIKAELKRPDATMLELAVGGVLERSVRERDVTILNALLNRVIGKELEPARELNVTVQHLQNLPTPQIIELGKEAIRYLEETNAE